MAQFFFSLAWTYELVGEHSHKSARVLLWRSLFLSVAAINHNEPSYSDVVRTFRKSNSWASDRLLVYSRGRPRLYNSISSLASIVNSFALSWISRASFRGQAEERLSTRHYRRRSMETGRRYERRRKMKTRSRAGRRWGTDEKRACKRTFEFSGGIGRCVVCKTGEGRRATALKRKSEGTRKRAISRASGQRWKGDEARERRDLIRAGDT